MPVTELEERIALAKREVEIAQDELMLTVSEVLGGVVAMRKLEIAHRNCANATVHLANLEMDLIDATV